MTPAEQHELTELLQHAKHLAKRYREITGRPLGITGEIAESEAVRLLGLELAPVRSPGYDVIRRLANGTAQHLQVKGRVLPATHKLSGQRMGSLDVNQPWDGVLLVLLDGSFNAVAIFEADRDPVIAALQRPGSKARNERGALAVPQFCKLAHQVWPAPSTPSTPS